MVGKHSAIEINFQSLKKVSISPTKLNVNYVCKFRFLCPASSIYFFIMLVLYFERMMNSDHLIRCLIIIYFDS